MIEPPGTDRIGRVAYIEPSQQWGYLHGPAGERVYFHETAMQGGLAELAPGTEVCFRVASGDGQPCAAQVVRCTRSGR